MSNEKVAANHVEVGSKLVDCLKLKLSLEYSRTSLSAELFDALVEETWIKTVDRNNVLVTLLCLLIDCPVDYATVVDSEIISEPKDDPMFCLRLESHVLLISHVLQGFQVVFFGEEDFTLWLGFVVKVIVTDVTDLVRLMRGLDLDFLRRT